MKELEAQVTSLELSKELKEAGYPQEGLWWWVYQEEKWGLENKHLVKMVSGMVGLPAYPKLTKMPEMYVAPTVAELGERLPMEPKPKTYFETTRIAYGNWIVEYERGIRHPLAMQMGNTEANARAKMLLYLVKEGLIKW